MTMANNCQLTFMLTDLGSVYDPQGLQAHVEAELDAMVIP
jgi:hypothetical protein